jgi:RimJ/RimL family protein N-acetyltransferase
MIVSPVNTMKIKGNRLHIRPIDTPDAEALTRIMNQSLKELRASKPWPSSPITVKEQRAFIERATQKMSQNKSLTYGVFLSPENECIGSISTHQIDWENFKTEVGYWIATPHTRKGYATEACVSMLEYLFMELGLHRVSASVVPDNVASLQVLKKLNFSYEGLAKEALYTPGKWKDLTVYALLADTYKTSRRDLFQKYVGGLYPKIQY